MSPMFRIFFWLLVLLAYSLGTHTSLAEYLPDRPTRYCNDYANLLKPETVRKLDRVLEGAEYQTSNQVVITLYRSLRSSAPIEEYCQRVAAAWHVGQPGNDNGVVFFYFKREQKFYIEVQPGLRSALSDVELRRIVAERMIPWVKANDFDGAVTQGVAAILADTQNAYQGDMKHAYWLHPPPQLSWRFRDYLPAFFLLSILFPLVFCFFSFLFKRAAGIILSFIHPAKPAVATYGGDSLSVAGKEKKLSSTPNNRSPGHDTSNFKDIAIGVGTVAGLLAVVFVGVYLWHLYLGLDRLPFLVVTAVSLCSIVLLPALYIRLHWEEFRDKKALDNAPPSFWKIVVSVVSNLATIVGVLVAVAVVLFFWKILGFVAAILGGGVFAAVGSLFALGAGLFAVGAAAGDSFGGGGGAGGSW